MKGVGVEREGGADREFPGLYRPGLIEGKIAHDQPPVVSEFPGLYRPGLIEGRSDVIGGYDDLPSFRGFTAPASLKGRAARRGSGRTGAVSGALPPRPH